VSILGALAERCVLIAMTSASVSLAEASKPACSKAGQLRVVNVHLAAVGFDAKYFICASPVFALTFCFSLSLGSCAPPRVQQVSADPPITRQLIDPLTGVASDPSLVRPPATVFTIRKCAWPAARSAEDA
jgi:hypothetical protein